MYTYTFGIIGFLYKVVIAENRNRKKFSHARSWSYWMYDANNSFYNYFLFFEIHIVSFVYIIMNLSMMFYAVMKKS